MNHLPRHGAAGAGHFERPQGRARISAIPEVTPFPRGWSLPWPEAATRLWSRPLSNSQPIEVMTSTLQNPSLSRASLTRATQTLARGPLWTRVALAFLVVGLGPASLGAAEANTPDDATVHAALERTMQMEIGIPYEAIDTSVEDGIVTLTGTVRDLLTRERTAKLAAQVRGVRSIVNRIQVEPAPREDATILSDVREALIFDPATESFEIDTKVEQGVVTLTGTVDSWQERRLAVHTAKGVRGVAEVVDSLSVSTPDHRMDTEIKRDVEGALRLNPWIADEAIEVSVAQGNVTLRGAVGSLAQRQIAEGAAWVVGARSVDVDPLVVEPWQVSAQQRPGPATPDDAQIAAAIETALAQDPRIGDVAPRVEVKNGTVTLSGNVTTIRARRAAENDARNTLGVRRVYNFLKVRPPEQADEETLEHLIIAALERNPITEGYEIDVDVRGSTVSLTGDVDTVLEKSEAERIAQGAEGVTAVRNRLSVDLPAHRTNDYAYDPIWDYDPEYRSRSDGSYVAAMSWSATSDAQIANNIRDEFFWSPFVDESAIEVDVDKGIATLSGDASTWSEYRAATENAYEGGAVYVVNNLDIPR